MSNWILRNRIPIFFGLAVAALIGVGAGAAVHGVAPGRALYVWILFATCMAPLMLMRTYSGRYMLLLFFMLLYFTRFGGLDAQAIVMGESAPPIRNGFFTTAEIAILLGGLLLCAGYVAAARRSGRAPQQPPPDWGSTTTLVMGLLLWAVGSVAFVTMHVFLQTEKTNLSAAKALDTLGQYGTVVIMLGFYVQPLGLLMLSYAYARRRDVFHTVLIIAVVAIQVAIGFVTDYKATAMTGLLVVMLVRMLIDDRISIPWIAAGAVFVVIVFPVFQAYRLEVSGERGLNRLQAFNHIGQVLEIAWAARGKIQSLPPGERPQTFIERSDLKGNIEQLVEHVGVDVPYLHGSTLTAIPMAFVPRILMPDKESVSSAQLYSRLISHTGGDTYISMSHLGELYWNFGWPGVLLGMFAVGAFMGWVAARFNFEQGPSLTRAMIFVVTVNQQVILFEGEVSNVYVVWLRSAAAIWLLHMVFARNRERPAGAALPVRMAAAMPSRAVSQQMEGLVAGAPSMPRYPNVLR